MKKLATLLIFLCVTIFAYPNDGVFYAAGNHLVPIAETDICVQKEVLTLKRVGNHIEVTVYYEFFNPTKEKDLLVGFEAESPYNSYPIGVNYYHPHMRNFTVTLNGKTLPYEVAHSISRFDESQNKYVVNYENGKIPDLTWRQCEDSILAYDGEGYPYEFVYHFNAHFQKGLNIVQHTYQYDLSFSIGEEFYFPYVLTAANRWANHQIDDFTLHVDMGDCESFWIDTTFYKDMNEWTCDGVFRKAVYPYGETMPIYHIQKGVLTFHKENFHPDGELYIKKPNIWLNDPYYNDGKPEPKKEDKLLDCVKRLYFCFDKPSLPSDGDLFDVEAQYMDVSFTDEQRRILRNLPFAYRGYVFKDKMLQQFYDSTDWYMPDPNYKTIDLNTLTERERKWVKHWNQ